MFESVRIDDDNPFLLGDDGTWPFVDFNDWFTGVVEEIRPSYIIAIARGAVRLLQLQKVEATLHDIPILSDYALPFLDDSEIAGRRILLFDDSVIFGSTLYQIRDYLIRRGALVFCAAYIVDRFNFKGDVPVEGFQLVPQSPHNEIPVLAKHSLWPTDIRRHHNKLIDSIHRTTGDYNLDFTKVRFTLAEFCKGDLPYLINLLRRGGAFREIQDVSSPVSVTEGVYRYTALLEPRVSGELQSGNLSFRPYSKARMIFLPDKQELLVTAMPQLALANDLFREDVVFKDDSIQRLWAKLVLPHKRDDEFFSKAVFRLLTFFIATILAESVTRDLESALRPDFKLTRSMLVDEDTSPAIGTFNCTKLKEIWCDLRSLAAIPGLAKETSETILDSQNYVDESLLTLITAEWKKLPWLKPHHGELIYEILGKVFLTLRAVTDSAECRAKNPGPARLEVGLTYEAIRLLLSRDCEIELSPDEISVAIDICVDNGQAVPKVIRCDGVWLRAFYSGEGEDAHLTLQFKEALTKGYSDFLKLKGAKPLTQFDMHKLCATLKDIFPWLPISTKPYTYGRYTRVGHNQSELIGWLVNRGSGPLKLGTNEDNRKVLEINTNYRSCVASTWDANTTKQFLDAFEYLASVFSTVRDNDPKLLLGTCRSHRHNFNAVAMEAHNWVENDEANFLRLITSAELTENLNLWDLEGTLDSLYWCIRFITEAREKYALFHDRFQGTSRKLQQAFLKQGTSAARFWNYEVIEKNLLDPTTDDEIKLKFSTLMPILSQMEHLTAYFTYFLLDSGLLKDSELEGVFARKGASLGDKTFQWLTKASAASAASKYNNNINEHKVTGLSIERTQLPLNLSPDRSTLKDSYIETTTTVRTCFDELSSSLFAFAPYYETLEGDFPFAPSHDRRVLPDGSVEKLLRNVFILTIEIIRSTNNIQTNQMKDFIIRTFDRFRRRPGLYFDISGNDAYVACSVDPRVLLDIARMILQEGEALKKAGGTFGGTRKGLFFGDLRYLVNKDGHPRVMDAVMPNVLPQAFYMLTGIDNHYDAKPESKNSAIIMDVATAKQVSPILSLELQRKDSFTVSSKHFYGKCYCVNLLNYKLE